MANETCKAKSSQVEQKTGIERRAEQMANERCKAKPSQVEQRCVVVGSSYYFNVLAGREVRFLFA